MDFLAHISSLETNYLYAAVGGAIGAWWVSELKAVGYKKFISGLLIAALWAAGLVEAFIPSSKVFTSAAAGIVVGVLSGKALEALKAAAPELVDSILNKVKAMIKK